MSFKYKTIKSIDLLKSFLLKQLEINKDIKIISFDVFDTLVHRRIYHDAIVEAVSQNLSNILSEINIHQKVNCLEARHRVYRSLIDIKVNQGKDFDVSLDDLVLPWVREVVGKEFDGDRAISKKIAKIEGEFEIKSCYPAYGFIDLIKNLKNRGIKIIYISDMYLGKKYVQKILDVCGFNGLFDGAYVSGDFSLLKRSGKLFDKVLDSENIRAVNLLHIGDNKSSDAIIPAGLGIRAIYYMNINMIKKLSRLKFDFYEMKRNPSWIGNVIAEFASAEPALEGTFEHAYGRRYLGPILANFLHKTIESCLEKKIETIYFFSREGFILKLIFDEFKDVFYKNEKIQGVYLGISRLSAFYLIADKPDSDIVKNLILNAKIKSLYNILAPYQIDKNKLTNISKKYGIHDVNIDLSNFYTNMSIEHLLLLILRDEEAIKHIKKKFSKQSNLLSGYLKDVGFFNNNNLAVVDLGWGGQIQSYIAKKYSSNNMPTIHGFYFGINNLAKERETNKSRFHGVADFYRHDFFAYSAFEFVQGLEYLCRAPHGTVVGYAKKKNHITPKIKQSKNDLESNSEAKRIEIFSGAISYAKSYKCIYSMFNFDSQDATYYSSLILDRAIRRPSKNEIDIYLDSYNNSDFGSSVENNLSEFSPYLRYSKYKLFKYILPVYFGGQHIPINLKQNGILITSFVDKTKSFNGKFSRKRLIKDHFFNDIRKNYLKKLNSNHKEFKLIKISNFTKPLTTFEFFTSYFIFHSAKILLPIKKRFIENNNLLILRPWVSRHYFNYINSDSAFHKKT
jgi:predicted HAD superfamily hydrolase